VPWALCQGAKRCIWHWYWPLTSKCRG
jgi:hypothetical protein